jgi:hypothetical protein
MKFHPRHGSMNLRRSLPLLPAKALTEQGAVAGISRRPVHGLSPIKRSISYHSVRSVISAQNTSAITACSAQSSVFVSMRITFADMAVRRYPTIRERVGKGLQ